VDHPTDIVVSVVLGFSIRVLFFRLLVPNDAYPVVYALHRQTAHLDVTGARGEAIRRAAREQLGLLVVSVESFGLGGSAGSTPLRLRLDGESPTYVFAKLYARNHLRADRWFKLGRSVLYGSLEDEAPFETVRRLVQYEDYLLRLMRDVGLPTPTPYGVVVLTPEREYLVVCEFFDGAVELGDAQIDDAVIDDALSIVRRLRDAGLAHRDIKPSNLLLHGRVRLIDVAFAEVRPSPWRQAVDLANMMLVLGLRANAQRFYRRALRQFRPEEIAEAFAASRGVTIPSQSRDAAA
jgi:tRNA A-37 threonylcarbamoyl transferase component Bud32